MRISSEQQFQQGVDNILRQQAKLNETQEQLASGNRILTPSDDPSASTQLIKMSALIARNKQYDRNVVFAQNQLQLAESKLASAGNVVQRVRELVIQGNSAVNNNVTRQAIGREIDNLLGELLDIANSKDAAGEYIFSGFNAGTKPFVSVGDGIVYQGDQGERFLQVSEELQLKVRDSGHEVFAKIKEGDGRFSLTSPIENRGTGLVSVQSGIDASEDTYTLTFTSSQSYSITNGAGEEVLTGDYVSGARLGFNGIEVTVDGEPSVGDYYVITPARNKDVFTSLKDIADLLSTPVDGPNQKNRISNELGQTLNSLDQVLDKFLSVRASIGNRLQQLDVRAQENADAKVRYDRAVSELKDLDYAEAVSRLNMQMTGLQAAQQAYIKVQGLSLFNFLR